MRSVYDAVKALAAVRPVAASAAATAIAIDTLGFNSAMFVIQNGAATGTPDSYTVDAKVQECATSGGQYADVTGATLVQITADSKTGTIRVEGLGTSRMRYLKLIITPAMTGGTSPKALISGSVLLGRAFQAPVGNSSTAA